MFRVAGDKIKRGRENVHTHGVCVCSIIMVPNNEFLWW